MNEAVKTMIERLHARLDDLSVVVDGVPYELAGYDKKLDKIDDQIYLIECEIEKKTAKSVPLEPVSEAESAAFDNATQAKDPKRTAAASSSVSESEEGVDEKKEEVALKTAEVPILLFLPRAPIRVYQEQPIHCTRPGVYRQEQLINYLGKNQTKQIAHQKLLRG